MGHQGEFPKVTVIYTTIEGRWGFSLSELTCQLEDGHDIQLHVSYVKKLGF